MAGEDAAKMHQAIGAILGNGGLVDVSAPCLVGGYLKHRSRRPLYRLAKSPNLWEQHISIIATQHFLRGGEFANTLKISYMLLKDKEDWTFPRMVDTRLRV